MVTVAEKQLRPDVPEDPSQLPGGSFSEIERFLALMRACWAAEPKERPTFESIITELRAMSEVVVRSSIASSQQSAGSTPSGRPRAWSQLGASTGPVGGSQADSGARQSKSMDFPPASIANRVFEVLKVTSLPRRLRPAQSVPQPPPVATMSRQASVLMQQAQRGQSLDSIPRSSLELTGPSTRVIDDQEGFDFRHLERVSPLLTKFAQIIRLYSPDWRLMGDFSVCADHCGQSGGAAVCQHGERPGYGPEWPQPAGQPPVSAEPGWLCWWR